MGKDLREVKLFDTRHRLALDGGTADDKAFRLAGTAGGLDSLIERRADDAAWSLKILVAGEHVVYAVRERASNVFVVLATEDDGMPCRDGLEALEVLRQVPRQVPVAPDDIVFRNSYNCGNKHSQWLVVGG